MRRRGSGILLHITSLPSQFGIGDCGPGAYEFVDFLSRAGQSYWQILPLTPTASISGHSPYASLSSYAGNPLLISPKRLQEMRLISESALETDPGFDEHRVDFRRVVEYKTGLLREAYEQYQRDPKPYQEEFHRFQESHKYWLDDFATFIAFKTHFDEQAWCDWPVKYRDRQPEAVNALQQELQSQIEYRKFVQFLFYRQWQALKNYCNSQGIQIIGDIPYYVSYDSADVWTNQEIFKLNEEKRPTHVGGVPPDYFSETGQLWGNPVYDWDTMQEQRYQWWIRRINHNFRFIDVVRIDHFRGFNAYWEVPADEETAVNGEWIEVPTDDFFRTVFKYAPHLSFIAEDLGVITPDVRETIRDFGFPGMRVLQFAFDDTLPRNEFAPHNHIENCVLYTGTHDNNTTRGWFEEETDESSRELLFRYLGHEVDADRIHEEFIRMAMMSVANTVILPMQDILGLDSGSRMNLPGTADGNWKWRVTGEALNEDVAGSLRSTTALFGRTLRY